MANNKLQERFGQIRSREMVLTEIQETAALREQYLSWSEENREYFLDILSGAKGIKMLYDSFFKIIMSPSEHPERLEQLLSLLLGQKITILEVMPNESTKIADEGTLLIMDITVRLADGSLAHIECQKVGYLFPGQRAACYSADLLMRQYRQVRTEKKKKFSYYDIKSVYTIVFFETSPTEFHATPEAYVHHSCQATDTGVKIDLLQKYVFISLDTFGKIHHNKIVDNELDAWLMFLNTDDPQQILALLDAYPRFHELYQDIYEICANTERVMQMFSKELSILDRNTVNYMIDEMETRIKQQEGTITSQESTIANQAEKIKQLEAQLQKQKTQ